MTCTNGTFKGLNSPVKLLSRCSTRDEPINTPSEKGDIAKKESVGQLNILMEYTDEDFSRCHQMWELEQDF